VDDIEREAIRAEGLDDPGRTRRAGSPETGTPSVGPSYDEAVGLDDVRREDMLGAIALLDDPVEGPRLLDELHFGPVPSGPGKDQWLVYKGRFYDPRAVIGIAHGL
ncbi:MAG: hypothetical protein WA752_27920, partial [Mycobacterium sp.]